MQHCFDNLYAQSVNGQNFYDLMSLISSNENIRLAYRNIKRNTGSKTAGTNKLTIDDIKYLAVEEVIEHVQHMFQAFRPNRSTHHAKARFESLINMVGLYHCIDVDIKVFFDNVHHSKLLKQI